MGAAMRSDMTNARRGVARADGSIRTRWMACVRAVALATCVFALAIVALPAQAQAPSSDGMQEMINKQLEQIPSGKEGVKQIMDGLNQELTLTDAQKKDIRPTVKDAVASMEKSRDRFKAGELTPMALGMQLQIASKKSAVLIEPFLTEEQLVKYKAMQQAQRRQMMQAMSKSNAMGGAPQ